MTSAGPPILAYMAISTPAVEPLASDPTGAEAELRSAYEYFTPDRRRTHPRHRRPDARLRRWSPRGS